MQSAVLHPAMRMSFFEDRSKWSVEMEKSARLIMQEEYDAYAERYSDITNGPSTSSQPASSPAGPAKSSFFAKTIRRNTPTNETRSELDRFFDMTQYECSEDVEPLDWLRVSATFSQAHPIFTPTISEQWTSLSYSLAHGPGHPAHSCCVGFRRASILECR